MAQWVRCLPRKPENLSSDMAVHVCELSGGKNELSGVPELASPHTRQ